MIWRLTYCNKEGVEARLDIIKGSSTPIEVIEGTATPFKLNYKMDKPDKSGFFMTSSADISIFETTSFNIDSLKTSSETEIKVEHYIDNILDWSGFVIPDFFSKTIGSPSTVEMVASDRLATLKGVTLTDLNQYVSMRDLAVACLAHTGLSLPLYTMADFGNDGQTNAFFKALGLSSRLSDTKGRNISCYDILKSILVASNSKLVQQDGAWHIVNKWQHEQGTGNLFSSLTNSTPYNEQTINFSDVHVGGRRSIVPVAAITGVYHEFGGGRSYPDNFDFRDFGLIPEFNFPGWTKAGTFNVARGDKEIIGYSFDGQMQFGTNTVDSYFFNSNVFNTSNYLQMDGVPVPYTTGQIEVVLDLNATAQTVSQFLTNVTAVKIALGAVKDGSPTIWLNNNGIFAEDNAVIHNLNFDRGATYEAQTKGFNLKGVINNPEGYSIIMRIYGSRDEGEDNRRQIAIHFARIEFKNTQDAPKGIIYKRKQGTDFTKEHDIDTTIFGDYMRKGLDGYFYEYPFDDTSSLYRTAGTLTQPLWTAPNDADQLPLLHHITRQKSRMFSLAHNMISARINVSSFKPLNIFIDCNSERYVVVSATYDFLRSEVEVELEQIAYATLDVRDFIYSYFGDGESGISSVGGISGGGGGSTGGGLTPEQIEILSFWKKDPDNPNTIFTEMNAYSKLELSAYGAGDGGGGGGSDYERLDTWADYDSSKAGWVLSAFLGNDLNTRVTAIDSRVTDLENSAGSGSVTSVGISVPTGLSVSNSPITSSGVIAISLQTGYSIPTTEKQGQWDAVVTDFGNLEIGGRNYFSIKEAKLVQNVGGYKTVTIQLLPNTQYIASTSVPEISPTTFNIFADKNPISRSSGVNGLAINKPKLITTDSTGKIDVSAIASFIDNIINGTYYFQIEKGNKATDWSPAPEDQVSDWNTTDVNSFSYIKNKPTLLSQFTDNIGVATHIANTSNPHSVTKSQVGLGNVDNTSDLLKPISNATQTALDLKANLASPTFSGTVTAPTLVGDIATFSTNITVGSSIITVTKIDNWDEVRTWWQNVGQYLKRDATNQALYTDENFYSTKEVSAYGLGSSGGGGSGLIETVYNYNDLGQTFNNSTLTDTFNAYTINQINTRLVSVENGSALTVNTTGTGNAITSISKSGTIITADKGLTFSLSNHLHSASDITSGTFDIARIPTGTTGATVALGNHLHTGIYEPVFSKNTAFNKNFGTASGTVAEGNHTHSYLPLSGGTLTGNINITPILGTLGVRTHRVGDSAYMWPYGNSLSSIRTGLGFGWYDTEWIIGNIRGGSTDSYGFGIGYRNADGNLNGEFRIAVGGIAYLNNVAIATVNSNVASATKLQTPRTIAGVSFDGTANIAIPFANLSSKPTTLGGYGITDAVTLNTVQTITGAKTFNNNVNIVGNTTTNRIVLSSVASEAHIEFSRPSYNYITAPLNGGISFVTNGERTVAPDSMLVLSPNGNVGIGKGFADNTASITAQLHVRGDILATGTTTTTKVIFNSAGWSMEQVGSELQMKHNNVLKMRFTSTGSIVATEEITAHG